MTRAYITVIVETTPTGDVFPKMLCLDDGRHIPIDGRLESPKRHRAKDGSDAWRFPCMIEGRPVTLYHDVIEHRWWIDRRDAR
ncbi:MAG: hypothetical protein ACOYH4_04315 [Saccharofermentanales bacterium]|jgi:hypothetical protein